MITSIFISATYLAAMNDAAEEYHTWEEKQGFRPVKRSRPKAEPKRSTFGKCKCGALATHKRAKECDPCFVARRAEADRTRLSREFAAGTRAGTRKVA